MLDSDICYKTVTLVSLSCSPVCDCDPLSFRISVFRAELPLQDQQVGSQNNTSVFNLLHFLYFGYCGAVVLLLYL